MAKETHRVADLQHVERVYGTYVILDPVVGEHLRKFKKEHDKENMT